MLKSVLSCVFIRKGKGKVAMPGPGSPNGIYVYDGRGRVWKVLRAKGDPFKLGELGDGLYVIYFDNLFCPACRSQDHHIYKIVSRFGGKPGLFFVVILCDWFADNCASEAASKTFREFKVSASPTIIVTTVKNSEIVQERLEGVRNDSTLEYYIKKFLETG